MKKEGFNTKAVHAGELRIPEIGNVVTPVFHTTTFSSPNTSENPYLDKTREKPYLYTRVGNPTIQALEEKYASVEESGHGISFSSGMGAITSTILSMASSGARILSVKELYGETYEFLTTNLRRMGIGVDFISIDRMNSLDFDPAPYSLVYAESIVNPTLKVADLASIAPFCREKEIPLVVDATFASPYNQNPVSMGASIVVHSGTKYIAGHSDVTLGLVGTSDNALRDSIVNTRKNFGPSMDPGQAYLALRGLKTMGLRVSRQNAVALELARFLEQDSRVYSVMYPGLESSGHYPIARRNLRGSGGMLSFELKGGIASARKFLKNLRIPSVAASLGGIESLVTLPVETSHASVPENERLAMGITDGMIRFSCGIEDPEDLVEDMGQALSAL